MEIKVWELRYKKVCLVAVGTSECYGIYIRLLLP